MEPEEKEEISRVIEITDQMLWAGLRALEEGRGSSDDFSLVKEIYAAMRAIAPED